MKRIIQTGLFLFALLLSIKSYPEEDGVAVLKDDTFEQFINEHEFVLIRFFAPWSRFCRELAPQFAKAARYFKEEDADNVAFGILDATTENKIKDKYNVNAFPSMRWFVKGKPLEYTGERSYISIVDWVSKKITPPSKEIKSEKEFNEIKEANDVFILFINDKNNVNKESEKSFENFKEVAYGYDSLLFFHTNSEELISKLDIKEFPAVSLFMKYDNKRADFPKNIVKKEKFRKWIEENQYPPIMPMNLNYKNRIFKNNLATMFFFYSKEDPVLFETFKKILPSIKEKILLATCNILEGVCADLAKTYGIPVEFTPTIMIFSFEGGFMKFQMDGEITESNILKFYSEYLNKKLPIYYKTQVPPAKNNGAVKLVVGKTWESIVAKSKKTNVLVKFFASWCGVCKSFKPVYEKFAKIVRKVKNNNLLLVEIDATENEIPGENINSYPTIKLYRKNRSPIEFKEGKTIEGLVDFFKKEAPEVISDKDLRDAVDDFDEDDDDDEKYIEEEEVEEKKPEKKTKKPKKEEDEEEEEAKIPHADIKKDKKKKNKDDEDDL